MLWIDLETYSDLDIGVGTYRYAESAEVMLIAYAIDDGPAAVWDVTTGDPMPDDLRAALASDMPVTAHNAMFDRAKLGYYLDVPTVERNRWRCTMVQALQHALPPSLDELARVLGATADERKLADGKKLIQRFCKPAPANHKVRRYTRQTHPDEWARFIEYATRDIDTMRFCAARMPTINWGDKDIALYHLDQQINDRGFCVDMELAWAGQRAAENEKAALLTRFRELTGLSPTQRAAVQDWLNANYALGLTSTARHAIEPLALDVSLPPDLREIAGILLAANKTSTAKYASLAAGANADGRFRGGLQVAGAGRTRRWAGRTFQPQNLPSRGLPKESEIESYIAALKAGVHDLTHSNLMLFGAAALRGCVVAPTGDKLSVADLANIEGRLLAWVAGEAWKIDAFHAYDNGTGPDLYNVTASGIVGGDPWHTTKKNRNVFGKVPELACGYGGGVGAFDTFAKAYGVRMSDHSDTIRQNIPAQFSTRAMLNFDEYGHQQAAELGIDKATWVACETVKLAWRYRHPATVNLWKDVESAVRQAITTKGADCRINQHLSARVIERHGADWLFIALPSGNSMVYLNPELDDKGRISYWGMGTDEGTVRAWTKLHTYGGKLVENIVQALAGDILKANMPDMEVAGYRIVLTVHDEVVAECPDSAHYGHRQLAGIMSRVPAWAEGLPLSAAGFDAYRYKKED